MGSSISVIGLGTAFFKNVDYKRIVGDAFKAGYVLIDTANMYYNERRIGKALKELGVARSDFFIASKLWPCSYSKRRFEKDFQATLDRLGVEYLDTMFLHKPVRDYVSAFRALIKEKEKGRVCFIGLSNFNVRQIEKIYAATGAYPDVIQNEVNVRYYDEELLAFCKEHNIAVQGWSPFENKRDEKSFVCLQELANKYHKTPRQIALRFILQLGVYPIVKSKSYEHQKSNIEIFDFALTDDDMALLKGLHKKDRRYLRAFFWWIDSLCPKFPDLAEKI